MVKNKKGFFQEYKEEIFNWSFAITTILVVIIFYRNIWLTNFLVLLIAIIGLFHWKSKRTLVTFILGSIFGVLAEMLCIQYGVWEYSFTNFYNVPIWLFFVWGNASAFLYQTAKLIKERKLK